MSQWDEEECSYCNKPMHCCDCEDNEANPGDNDIEEGE